MRIQLVQDFNDLSSLEKDWNDLLSRSAADTIFLTWEWLSSWWRAYAISGNDLYVIAVRGADGRLAGIAPLCRRARSWLPFFPVKTLQLIGDGSSDSDYLDFILAKGQEEAILDEVWRYLRSEQRTWHVLRLAGVPEGSPTLRWLSRLCAKENMPLCADSLPCGLAQLPPSWEEYMASLKPRFRTKVRTTLRRLTEGHDVRFYSIENEADLPAGLEALFDLHHRRWKLKGREGVFVSPAKRRFYENFTRLFLKRGWLAFDFLEVDGQTAACQLCFRYNGTQFLLQEGFDPQFSQESAGIALRAMVFRKAIEDGIRTYDFLAGLGRHKTQWQVETRQCRNVSLGPRTVQNMLYLKVPPLIEATKDRLKTALGKWRFLTASDATGGENPVPLGEGAAKRRVRAGRA